MSQMCNTCLNIYDCHAALCDEYNGKKSLNKSRERNHNSV